jgi:hypothetical protein
MYRKFIIGLTFVVSVVALPLLASAAMSEMVGTIDGLNCVARAVACPSDKLDPHLATESTFVLDMGAGKYYLLTNVKRDVLIRHALEKVKVIGVVNEKYNSITVSRIETEKGGKWMEAWSMEAERAQWDREINQMPK